MHITRLEANLALDVSGNHARDSIAKLNEFEDSLRIRLLMAIPVGEYVQYKCLLDASEAAKRVVQTVWNRANPQRNQPVTGWTGESCDSYSNTSGLNYISRW